MTGSKIPHPSFKIKIMTLYGEYRPTPEEEAILRQTFFFEDGSVDRERTPKHVLDFERMLVERETARMKAKFV